MFFQNKLHYIYFTMIKKQKLTVTRGPVGLYCSPGFCHIYSFINLWEKYAKY